MKKQILWSVWMLLAMLTFTACSDDDGIDLGNGQTIEINGVTYPISPFVEMVGEWDGEHHSGDFTVTVDVEHNGMTYADYYQFSFTNYVCPTVGDDFSEMNLTLLPLLSDPDIDLRDYAYKSGKAIVTDTNPSDSQITIRFENLQMSAGGDMAFTFNGTVTLPFTYDGW